MGYKYCPPKNFARPPQASLMGPPSSAKPSKMPAEEAKWNYGIFVSDIFIVSQSFDVFCDISWELESCGALCTASIVNLISLLFEFSS